MAENNNANIVISATDKTKEAVDSVKRGLDDVRLTSDKLNSAMALLLPALGAAAFTEIIKSSTDAADNLFILSERSGLTVEAVNGLSFAAKLGGASTEEMAKGVQKLSIYMADAQINGGKHADMLKSLGITAKDPMEAMYQLADALKSIEDPAQRTYVATQLMGKGGAAMIPTMLEGGDALKKMVEEGQRLNPVTTEFAAQANALNDNLDRLKISAQGNATLLAEGMVPAINDVVQAYLDFGHSSGVTEEIGKALGETLRVVAFSAGYVVMSFKDVGNQIGALAAQAVALAQGDWDAVKSINEDRKQQAAQIQDDFDKFAMKITGVASASADASRNAGKAVLDLADAAGVGNKSMDSFIGRIKQMTEQFNTAAETGKPLTESQKMQIELNKLIEAGTLDVSEAQRKHIQMMLGELSVAEQLKIEKEKERQAHEEANKLIEKSRTMTAESLAQLQFEISLTGKSTEDIKRLTAERNADLAVQKQIAALHLDPKLKDDPEAIKSVTAQLLSQAEAEKALFKAKQGIDLQGRFNATDPGASEEARYKKQLDELKAFHNAQLISDADYRNRTQQADSTHQQALYDMAVSGVTHMNALQQFALDSRFASSMKFFDKDLSAAAQHSRAAFNVLKTAKMAEAIVHAASSIGAAYDYGQKETGSYWGGIAYAAGMAALQAVQISAIAGSEFGGGTSAPSAGGVGAGAISGQTANQNVVSNASVPSAPGQSSQLTINVYNTGNVLSNDYVAGTIIPQIKDAVTNNDVVIIDPRSRQAAMLVNA